MKASGRLLAIGNSATSIETEANTGRQVLRYGAWGAAGNQGHVSDWEWGQATSQNAQEREAAKYAPVVPSKAVEAEWQKQYDEAGPWVNSFENLITGSVLPIWAKIQERESDAPNAHGKPVKVKIAKLDNGTRLIGAYVESQRIGKVLKALGHAPVSDPEAVMRGLLGGKKYELMQGGSLRRATVSGQPRIELEGAAHFQRLFRDWGLYTENIGSKDRWFIPTGAGGLAVIKRVLKELPLRGEEGGEEQGPATLQSRMLGFYSQLERTVADKMTGKLPAGIFRLKDSAFPGTVPAPDKSPEYWKGADSKPTSVEGKPALLVNNASVDVIARHMGPAGNLVDSQASSALTLYPNQQRSILDEARKLRGIQPDDFQKALLKIARQIASINPGLKPLVVVQTGESIPDRNVAINTWEEIDHTKQIALPNGLADLPVDAVESPLGARATDALVTRMGYVRPNEQSQYYEQHRQVMAAEIGVRLMRPGRYTELNLTAEEAATLGQQFIDHLEEVPGPMAGAIVEQTRDTIRQNQFLSHSGGDIPLERDQSPDVNPPQGPQKAGGSVPQADSGRRPQRRGPGERGPGDDEEGGGLQSRQPGEVGPHGPILRQFHHDAQGALAYLLREGTGDAIGALHHPGVGDFDLTADIAAKLRDEHPEVMDDLQGFISKLSVLSESTNRIILASEDRQQRAAVRLDYDGVAKRWLLSAYDKNVKRPTRETTDASGTLTGEGTTAPSGRDTSTITPKEEEVNPRPNFLKDEEGSAGAPKMPSLISKEVVPAAKQAVGTTTKAWDEFMRWVAPQTRGPQARRAYGMLRERGADLELRKNRAEEAVKGLEDHFLKQPEEMGVHGLNVIDAMQGVGDMSKLKGDDLRFAQVGRELLDQREAEIKRLGLLKHYLENYFPQAWKDPEAATAWVQNWQTKRPFAGKEAYRKKRTYPTMREGLEDEDFHLEPKFNNPVAFLLDKLAEMDKSITAHDVFEELNGEHYYGRPAVEGEPKPQRDLKYVGVFDKAGAGWKQVDDRIFKVYGKPTVTVTEAFDAQLRARLQNLADVLGIQHERKVKIGGERLGYATSAGKVVTKFGTPDSVLAHEIGHQLQYKYDFMGLLKKRADADKGYPERTRELRALADLRFEGATQVADSFKRYVREKDEKAANAIAALVYAPRAFREVAPNTWDFLRDELWHIPKLRPLFDIGTTMTLGTDTAEVPVGGLVTMGNYYAPTAVADLINSQLAPGIRGNPVLRVLNTGNRMLNMFELGWSYFHGMTTTLNASISDVALGLEQTAAGKPLQGLVSTARGVTPFASAVRDVIQGKRLQDALLKGDPADPVTAAFADVLKQAGGQAKQDTFWTTQFTRSMMRVWREHNGLNAVIGVGLHLPLVATEQSLRPIMEYMVPRVKLAAFARLAKLEAEKHPDMSREEARALFGKAWDSIDNRFGQLNQRNLMMHPVAKDIMNVFLGRPGWNIGTVREMGGGGLDLARVALAVAKMPWTGKPPELTHRAAFLLASFLVVAVIGAMLNRILSGEWPRDIKDMMHPRDGGMDENGKESRITLPFYLTKDVESYLTRPGLTIKGKASPVFTFAADLVFNRNFQNTKIYGEGGMGVGKYVAGAFTPYGVQGLTQNLERGEGAGGMVGPLLGVMPASKHVGETSAEALAAQYSATHREVGARSETQGATANARGRILALLRSGKDADAAIEKAINLGLLTQKDVGNLQKAAQSSRFESTVSHLPFNEALDVFAHATPAERDEIETAVTKLVLAASKKPEAQWTPTAIQQAQKYFDIQPRE